MKNFKSYQVTTLGNVELSTFIGGSRGLFCGRTEASNGTVHYFTTRKSIFKERMMRYEMYRP